MSLVRWTAGCERSADVWSGTTEADDGGFIELKREETLATDGRFGAMMRMVKRVKRLLELETVGGGGGVRRQRYWHSVRRRCVEDVVRLLDKMGGEQVDAIRGG